MAQWKVVFSFEGAQGETWNDVWYREASGLNEALTLSPELIGLRCVLLDNSNRFRSYRVSNILGNRQAQSITVNRVGEAGRLNSPPATPGVSAVFGLGTVAGGSRKWWLRGFATEDMVTDKDTNITTWQRAATVNNFMQVMANHGFGVLKLTPLTRTPDQFPPIVAVAANDNPSLTDITLANNTPGIDKPDRIIISQMSKKDYPGLSGSFLVLAKDGLKLTIRYRIPPYAVPPKPTGQVRKQTYLTPISPFLPERCKFAYPGTHRTKDFFDNTRGRRSAVRIRQSP